MELARTATIEQKLQDYLERAFTPEIFHAFLAERYPERRYALPSLALSPEPAQYFSRAVTALGAWGLIDRSFLNQLSQAAPTNADEPGELDELLARPSPEPVKRRSVVLRFEADLKDVDPEWLAKMLGSIQEAVGLEEIIITDVKRG